MTTGRKILLGVTGILLVCGLGSIGALIVDAAKSNTDTSTHSLATSRPGNLGASKTGTKQTTPPAPPKPTVVKGRGNVLVHLKAPLAGTYRVEYSFGSWCGQADFLKSDGSSGAGFMEDLNECAADLNSKANGSKLVHLDGVSMIQIGNTDGAWTLTFTAIK